MKDVIEDIRRAALFEGIAPEEIDGLLECLCPTHASYVKGDYIIQEGHNVYDFGIVLSGHARSIKWDSSGRLIIITLLKQGSEIGVVLAASSDHKSPVTVEALEDVSVLQFSFEKVFSRCEKACPKHDKLLRNLINIVAEKGMVLHERIDCLLRPTVREKILTYLERESKEQQVNNFTIPMNRNAMAEYLNVERSALSRELSYMKRDGIIDYNGNTFRLLH